MKLTKPSLMEKISNVFFKSTFLMKKEEIGLHFPPGGGPPPAPPPSERAAGHGQEICSPEAGFCMPASLQLAQGDSPTSGAEQLAEGPQSYLPIQPAPSPSLRLLFSFCRSATDRLDSFFANVH